MAHPHPSGPLGPSRRGFLTRAAGAAGALAAVAAARPPSGKDAVRKFLEPYVVTKETLGRFLDPKARVWAKFDPELGYLLRNSFVRDGVDGSHTLARYAPAGQRLQVNFPDQPCRLNTYGDSFTQGHQVSDGETWQEILAAHFCEPVRNFGIGGFGVYQAYRRLLRTEATGLAAKFLIFNIWGDDHYRSVYAWRLLSFPVKSLPAWSGVMFHANPWVHARLDPNTGELVEKPNVCPDEATLRRLSDLDFLLDRFGNDEVVHLLLANREGVVADRAALERVAAALKDKDLALDSPAAVRATASRLLHAYAVRVGMKIMDRLKAYCDQNGKKLLVLLSYPQGSVWHACNGTAPGGRDNTDWHPQAFKDHLSALKVPFVDTLTKHVAEFKTFRLTPREYVDRYYIGHYTPRGNHFFAYAVKDEVLAWLDPKPPAYRDDGEPLIRFKGYLPG